MDLSDPRLAAEITSLVDRRVAAALQARSSVRYGLVASVDTGAGSCAVYLGASPDASPGFGYAPGVVPEVGDRVRVRITGADRYVEANLSRGPSGGGGGVTAHSALTGLAADDHPQYATDAALVTHENATNPHAGYATDADLSAHVAAGDPHTAYATDADLATHAGTPHGGGGAGHVFVPESATSILNETRTASLGATLLPTGAPVGAVAVQLHLWGVNTVTPNAGNALDVRHSTGTYTGSAVTVRGNSAVNYWQHGQAIVWLGTAQQVRYVVTVAGGTFSYQIWRVGYWTPAGALVSVGRPAAAEEEDE